MSVDSTLPTLESVDHEIGERLRDLRLLRSLRHALQRKCRDDEIAMRNQTRRTSDGGSCNAS